MKHTDSLEAAVKHCVHCALAAGAAVERGDSVERVQAYLADVMKWTELSRTEIEGPTEGEVTDLAARFRPAGRLPRAAAPDEGRSA